jgi:hypothetical protein
VRQGEMPLLWKWFCSLQTISSRNEQAPSGDAELRIRKPATGVGIAANAGKMRISLPDYPAFLT